MKQLPLASLYELTQHTTVNMHKIILASLVSCTLIQYMKDQVSASTHSCTWDFPLCS
jgi:hypothetical protein